MKGEVMSRKIAVLMGLLSVVLCFAGGSTTWAWIPPATSGTPSDCLDCHIDEDPMVGTLKPEYQGETGCITCHSSSTSSTIYTLNPEDAPFAPIGIFPEIEVPVTVYTGAEEPTEYLASGNFWWVKGPADGTPGSPYNWTGGGNDTGGHNIFPNENDERYTLEGVSVAPGHSSGCLNPESCHSNLNTADNTYGTRQSCLKCHMMMKGIDYPAGFHHANDTAVVVGMGHYVPGESGFDGYYRYLTGHMSGEGHGVAGIEDDDWEATKSPIDHNEYLGAQHALNSPGGFGLAEDRHTSTAYCSGCHGNFHVASEYDDGIVECPPDSEPGEVCYKWLRHPVGMVLPDDGDLDVDSDFDHFTTYNPNVPLGRPDLAWFTGPSDIVTVGTDVINCLSCHRSHGTPGGSHLRWDPTQDDACAQCHISKISHIVGQYICDAIDDCNDCHTSHGKSLRFQYEDLTDYPGVFRAKDEFGAVESNENLVWPKVAVKIYADDVEITAPTIPYDTYVQVATDDINSFDVGDVVEIRDDTNSQQLKITSVDTGANRYYFADDPLHAPHIYAVGTNLYTVELRDCIFPIPGDSPYVRAANPWDGVCEVCHTEALYWKYDGTGATHYGGPGASEQCLDCHQHTSEFLGDMPDDAPHHMHMDGTTHGPDEQNCNDCHLAGTDNQLAAMVAEGTCDNCHSPLGGYDGVNDPIVGAANNWTTLIRQPDGTITPGKERWCAGCHDSEPANSKADGSGVYAQMIAGDGSTWGFYVTGHGRSGIEHNEDPIECINCHDPSVDHIDGDRRTYAFDPSQYDPGDEQNPICGVKYAEGYRLKYIDNKVPLMIPNNYEITFGYDIKQHRENAYRLCLDSCHEPDKVFHNTPLDTTLDTNFMASGGFPYSEYSDYPKKYSHVWGNGGDINDHVSHILNYIGVYWDSDWDRDTTAPDAAPGNDGCDSSIACSSCHNVHGSVGIEGSTNEAMIRNGNLTGRAGYGFTYLVEDTGAGGFPMVTSTGATRFDSIGAVFRNDTGDMCIGCHGDDTTVTTRSYDASGWGLGTYLEYYRESKFGDFN